MAGIDGIRRLLSVAGNVSRLEQFLSGGDVVALLVDPTLNAAKAAFAKASDAGDPRQQLWSAVNHLEAAHECLKAIYARAWSIQVFDSRSAFLSRMAKKDRFVLCLMACCYKVLGELKLCEMALTDAAAVDSGRFSYYGMLGFLNLLDWRVYRESYHDLAEDAPYIDVSEFRRALM